MIGGLIRLSKILYMDVENKKEIDLEQMKSIQVGILDKVAEFCDKNHLRYYLSSGTLIGAIRHKGFIPWDDDVDLYMLRDDYEKFIRVFNGFDDNFRVLSLLNVSKYPYSAAKVEDCRTILIEKFDYPIDIGISIDIFPIDGVPDDIKLRKAYFSKIGRIRRLILLKNLAVDFKARSLFKNIVLYVSKILLIAKRADKLIKKLENTIDKNNNNSTYVCNLVMGNGYGTEYLRSTMNDTCEVEFEGKMYKTMVGYDEYLRKTYGDYMQLPPVEKRVTHHFFKAYWK